MSDRIKHGTICQSTGKVFWSYDSGGRERWFDKERFEEMRNRARANQRKRYWSNVEERRESLRNWHHANKEKKKRNFENWIKNNRDKVRGNRLKKKYGLSNEDYVNMFESQLGLCLICGKENQGLAKDGENYFLCVDHCHSTGKVRGLLCNRCNAGLGQFLDDPELLRNAAGYLEYYKNKESAPAQMGGVTTQGMEQ